MIPIIFVLVCVWAAQTLTAMERSVADSLEETEDIAQIDAVATGILLRKKVRFAEEEEKESKLREQEASQEKSEREVKEEEGQLSPKVRTQSKKSRFMLKVGKRLEAINKKGARALAKPYLDKNSPTAQLWLTETADKIKRAKKIQKALKSNTERYSAAKEIAGELYQQAKDTIAQKAWPAFVSVKKQFLKAESLEAMQRFTTAIDEARELFTEYRRNRLLLTGVADEEELEKEVEEELVSLRLSLEIFSASGIYESLLKEAKEVADRGETFRQQGLEREVEVCTELFGEILKECTEYYTKYLIGLKVLDEQKDLPLDKIQQAVREKLSLMSGEGWDDEIQLAVKKHFLLIGANVCAQTAAALWKSRKISSPLKLQDEGHLGKMVKNGFRLYLAACDKDEYAQFANEELLEACFVYVDKRTKAGSSPVEIQNQFVAFFKVLTDMLGKKI